MDINDLKNQINNRFENAPIQSSAFYADPEDHLDNQKKLRVTLKSFIETQNPDTPFALQIMATHSEITIMPLGLLDLDELKDWENKRRQESDVLYGTDGKKGFPIVVQFEPHVKGYELEKKVLDVYTDDLFNHFQKTFNDDLWPIVMKYLNANQTILRELEIKMVKESEDVKKQTLSQIQSMTPAQIKEKLGADLPESQFDHYSSYIADLSQVNAITGASAAFVKEQLLKDKLFPQMMNIAQLRNTFFWILDNTFNEIIYFYIQAYGSKNPKLKKHLNSIRKNLATMMRNDAWKKSNDVIEAGKKFQPQKFFTDVYMPIADNLEVEIDKFN